MFICAVLIAAWQKQKTPVGLPTGVLLCLVATLKRGRLLGYQARKRLNQYPK